jgi:hypothetical protein
MIKNIQKLILNKNSIISNSIEWMKSHHPNRTTEYDKCHRDLNYILDSFINDLSEDTTRHTINIGSRFWSNGVMQLRGKDVEIAVYDFMLLDVEQQNIVDNDALEKLRSLKDILVNIITNGPIRKMDFLEATISAQHCQRNWDLTKEVKPELAKWLLEIGLSTPTKQNLYTFDIVCVTDRKKINKLSKIAVNGPTENSHLTADVRNKIRVQNPQTDANLLFMFFIKPETRTSESRRIREKGADPHVDHWTEKVNLEIGLSASAIAIAANSIGMKSGFCRCIDHDAFPEDISEEIGLHGGDLKVMLGIGYPYPGLPHNMQVNGIHESECFTKLDVRRIII